MSSRKKTKVKRTGKSRYRPRVELLEQRLLLAGPEVDVLLGAQSLPVGDTVDFGAAVEDSSARVRTFTVYNSGDKPLVLGGVNLPDGFRLKEGLNTTIRARARDTFTVEMTTDVPGVKSGDLWFSTNDADEPDCYFAISGEITERVVGAPDLDVALVARDMTTVWNGATVDYGTANLRGAGAKLTFRVYNRGDRPLHLGAVAVPSGFRLADRLVQTIAPGRYDDFSIAMKTDALGVKTGTVRFGSDAAGDETFSFTVQGEVVKAGKSTSAAAMAAQAAASQRATVSHKPLVSSNPAWTWQTPTPPAQEIADMYFLNSREGWMAGQGRGLLHTTDGGKSWSNVQFGPPMGFWSVFFSDSQHGWAGGIDSDSAKNASVIWSTSDGGKTWQEQFRQPGEGLGHVVFADNLTGWALAEEYVVATTDGGRTWNRITLPSELNDAYLADIQVLDSQKIWILGHVDGWDVNHSITTNIVVCTEDGGQTWSASSVFGPHYQVMYNLEVLDKANVWMAGVHGFSYRYDAKGNSWTEMEQPFGIAVDTNIMGMHFTSPIEGWAVTQNGGVLHTIDGGSHWLVNSVIPRWSLSGLVFTSPTNGWLYGPWGVVYQTTDGGLSWQDLRQGTASMLMSVSFPTASHGWAVGSEGAIVSTKNAGKTWTAQASPVTTLLRAVHFVNSQSGWAVGEHGTILSTRDGGKHWNLQSSRTNSDLVSVYFATSKIGWAVGSNGTILNTQDGGTTWSLQNSNGNWDLTDVRFYDKLHGWATDRVNNDWAVVLRTDDGGAHWTPVQIKPNWKAGLDAPPLAEAINSVYFISPTVGWICGGYSSVMGMQGFILKTIDGGKTWETERPFDQNAIRGVFTAIWFVDKNNGYAVGEQGMYYTTTDGGANWIGQIRPCPSVYVTDVAFTGPRVGFMVGVGGAILKTTTGGR